MANMTLRLDENEEALINAVMQHYGENTKSKAFARMLKDHLEVIEARNQHYENYIHKNEQLIKLKDALKKIDDAKQRIVDLLV